MTAAAEVRTVWVVRHARSTGNAAGIFQGWSDPPLHPSGEADARLLAVRFARHQVGNKVGHVVASPLLRARATARLLFGRVDEVDAAWVEPAAPALQGLTVARAAELHGDLVGVDGWPLEAMAASERLETPASVSRRVTSALLAARFHPGAGDVAVVTHGSVVSALLAESGFPGARPTNLHVLRCSVGPDGWRLVGQSPEEPG